MSTEIAQVIDHLTAALLRMELVRKRTTDPAVRSCLDGVTKDVWNLASMMATRFALDVPERPAREITGERVKPGAQPVQRTASVWGPGTGDAAPEGVRRGPTNLGPNGIPVQLGE